MVVKATLARMRRHARCPYTPRRLHWIVDEECKPIVIDFQIITASIAKLCGHYSESLRPHKIGRHGRL